jgi:hypothetical protein
MSASADDFFHKVGRSTATTLSAPGYTIGDTSINVASTTNWPTSTGVTFAIDETDADGNRVSGTYNVFRGTVSGATQVNNLTYVGGDANRNYAAAATTRVYILVSAYRDNRFTDGVLVEHNQDGTHGAVTATSVTAATINATTDLQQNSVSLDTIRSEIISNFVASGGTVAQSAGLVGTFSNIVYYISGVRYTANSVANKTYTASKDTYVDINASGTVTYTEVANGAASPSLTAGNIRVAKVVTNVSAIASVVQAGGDSLGNPVSPNGPEKTEEWREWNPTLSGWSANPSGGVYYYCRRGKKITLNIRQPNNGTSNATTCTVTLPFTAVPRTNARWTAPAEIVDNGTAKNVPGLAVIVSGGSTVTVALDYAFNAFTASGNKRINSLTIEYEAA